MSSESSSSSSSNNNSSQSGAGEEMRLKVSSTVELPEISYKQTGEFLLMSSIKAPMYKPENRAAVDIVAVMDRSGSMAGEKLELVKKMLNHMVGTLAPEDQLSIVTYQDTVTTNYPFTAQTQEGKDAALSAIEVISTAGCTNLGGGLVQGVKELCHRKHKNSVASVLLFTDGLVNVGPTTAPLILNAAREATLNKGEAQSSSSNSNNNNNNNNNNKLSDALLPGTLNTFGFGADHDAVLLRDIAEKGSGVYYFIENASRITDSFADCFGGLLSTFAQDITLSLEAGTGVQIKKIIAKFPVTAVIPNAHYTVSLGDIQSEENRDILAVIELPALEQAQDVFPLMNITISYKNLLLSKMESKTITAVVARPENVIPGLKRDFELDKQHNRMIASEALEQAAVAGNSSDFEKANSILNSAISRIKESVSAADEFCVNLVADLEKCKEGLKNKQSYTSYGQQVLSHNYMAHTYQRSSDTAWGAQSAYTTSNRGYTQALWK